MATPRVALLSLIVFCVLLSPVAWAENSSKELPLEQVQHLLSLGDFQPSLSPDGRWLAYVTIDPKRIGQSIHGSHPFFLSSGTPAVAAGTDVRITDTDSRESFSVTHGNGANWGVSWSPDGKLLAYYSDQDGAMRLWTYDPRTRWTRRVSDAIVRSLDPWQVPVWSPDGRTILTKLLPVGRELAETNRSIGPKDAPKDSGRSQPLPNVLVYHSVSQAPSSDSRDYLPSMVENGQTRAESADLGIVDVTTGAVERLATGFNPVWYTWYPNGSRVVFATMKGLSRGEVYHQLFDLYDTAIGEPPKLIDSDIGRQYWDFSASWSPDGKELSYVTNGGSEDGECYILVLNGLGRRKATKRPHPPFGLFHHPPFWDASGRHLYFITGTYTLWVVSQADGMARELVRIPNHHILAIARPANTSRIAPPYSRFTIVSTINDATLDSEFYRVDLETGAFTRLVTEHKGHDPYRVMTTADGAHVIYAAEDVAHPPEFFSADAEFKSTRQLTNINSSLGSYQMGRSRMLEWRTDDGETVRGGLLLPGDYQEGKRYPLIVELYPGLLSPCANSFGLCGENFFPNKQLFASRGYAVLVPDLRLNGRTLARDLASTVLPGVNKAVDLGIVDSDRVGVMGTSWGGYLTLALLVQTARFKVAIMVAGFGDLFGLYGEMDEGGASLGIGILEEGNGKLRMPGSPWDFREVYLENSPVFCLDRVQTPLLIIHGDRDANVASFLSDEVFVGLRRLRKQATYVKYLGEVHGLHSYPNQEDGFGRMLDWFNAHLKAKEAASSSVLRPAIGRTPARPRTTQQ